MDESRIADVVGRMSRALLEATRANPLTINSTHHLADGSLVIEYRFDPLPDRIDLRRMGQVFSQVVGLEWVGLDGDDSLAIRGLMDGDEISVYISLR